MVLEIKIKLENFKGGHSGATIHKGQANPIKWITHILNTLKLNKIDFQINIFKGGKQRMPSQQNVNVPLL